MTQESIDIRCPGCGAPASIHDKQCEFCGRKLSFTSTGFTSKKAGIFRAAKRFMDAYQKVGSGSENDPAMLASLGFALFDQGRFKEASEKFQQALSQGIMESAIPLYCAAAEFRQKKSYQFSLSESKEIIAKVDEALAMEPSAGYLYAKGLLIQALFEQKYLQYKQKSVDVLEKANTAGLSDEDRIEITQILGVDKR